MDPSFTCHPEDGTAGPSSFSQIFDDDGPDDGSPHWPVVWPVGPSSFSATAAVIRWL